MSIDLPKDQERVELSGRPFSLRSPERTLGSLPEQEGQSSLELLEEMYSWFQDEAFGPNSDFSRLRGHDEVADYCARMLEKEREQWGRQRKSFLPGSEDFALTHYMQRIKEAYYGLPAAIDAMLGLLDQKNLLERGNLTSDRALTQQMLIDVTAWQGNAAWDAYLALRTGRPLARSIDVANQIMHRQGNSPSEIREFESYRSSLVGSAVTMDGLSRRGYEVAIAPPAWDAFGKIDLLSRHPDDPGKVTFIQHKSISTGRIDAEKPGVTNFYASDPQEVGERGVIPVLTDYLTYLGGTNGRDYGAMASKLPHDLEVMGSFVDRVIADVPGWSGIASNLGICYTVYDPKVLRMNPADYEVQERRYGNWPRKED